MSNLLVGTYFDIGKLVIWGESSGEDGSKLPRLVFSFRDGNPRLTVYTGVSGPSGVISFPSDYPTMVGIISILKDVIKAGPGTKFSIDSLTTVYEDNKPTKEKKVVSTLYIGKSQEGIIYFSVITEGKPKLVFAIKPSPYHVFKDSEKNILSDDVVSCKIAAGLCDLVLNIISNVIVNYTSEEYSGDRKPTQIKSLQNNAQQSSSAIIQELDDLDI